MAGRKCHIYRIFGKERNSDVKLDDVYADIRRTDEIEYQDPATGQTTIKQIYWEDGWKDNEPDDPDRKTKTLKITNPEDPPQDKDDPDQWIPIPMLTAVNVRGFIQGPLYSLLTTQQDAWQANVLSFSEDQESDVEDLGREVRVVRVPFAETPDNDAALEEEPIDEDEYHRNEETRDDTQYLDFEIIDKYGVKNVDQETTVELDNHDDLLESFEESPSDRPQRPVRLDPFQNIVNVQWESGIWVLVQVLGGANFPSASQSTMGDIHGNPVGSDVSLLTDGKVLYRRSALIGDDPDFAQNLCVVWADEPDGTVTQFVQIVDGFSISAKGHLDGSGNFTGVAVGAGLDPGDSAAISAFFAAHPTPGWVQHGPVNYTVRRAYVEAVYLIDSPKGFTVENSGFPSSIDVFIYPKSKLKVDRSNNQWGQDGGESRGDRVWFPINWKNRVPPYPKSPGGRDWPWPSFNFNIVDAPNQRDVINTAIFWIKSRTDGVTPSYPFKVEKREHYSAPLPPDHDPTLKDKIWQVYPTRVDDDAEVGGIENGWYVVDYSNRPFGEVFLPPDVWGLPSAPLEEPGPLPKIPIETPG